MRKTIKMILAGAGLMALTGIARADTIYNLTINPDPGGLSTGSYHVVLDESSLFKWHISSVTANGGASTPNASLNGVRIIFFSGVNASGQVILPGSVSGTGGVNAGGTNWGAAITQPAGFHPTNYAFITNSAGLLVNKNGSDTFSMSNGGNYLMKLNNVKSFAVYLNGDPNVTGGIAGNYYTVFNVTDFSTPEASSLAMLLPGLIPLGIALKRRRSARS